MIKFIRKRKKLNKKGASLIYAMLIMMVCTVISSVVLAAATSAAGRIVTASASDSRYYAVNSGVTLLKDVVEDSECNFQWTYVSYQTGTKIVSVDTYGNSTYNEAFEDPTTATELLVEGETSDGTEYWTVAQYASRKLYDISDIFTNASLDLLLGTDRTEDDEFSLLTAWNVTNSSISTAATASGYEIIMNGTGVNDVSEVIMTSEIASDDSLVVTLTTGDYAVKLVFKAEIEESTSTPNSEDINLGSPYYDASGNYCQDVRRINDSVRTITYKWYLESTGSVG